MTRLKLTWLASEGTAAQASKTFRIMMIITVTYIVLSQAYAAVLNATASTDVYGHPSTAYVVTYYVGEALRLSYFVFLVCLVIRTRRHIRQKYRIPEGDCGGCDDCCSSFWCACCAVAQMAVSAPTPPSPTHGRDHFLRVFSPRRPPLRGTRPITTRTRGSVAARPASLLTLSPSMRRRLPRRPSCDCAARGVFASGALHVRGLRLKVEPAKSESERNRELSVSRHRLPLVTVPMLM